MGTIIFGVVYTVAAVVLLIAVGRKGYDINTKNEEDD